MRIYTYTCRRKAVEYDQTRRMAPVGFLKVGTRIKDRLRPRQAESVAASVVDEGGSLAPISCSFGRSA